LPGRSHDNALFPAAPVPPAEFPVRDETTVSTDYRCPACGYEWSGSPK